MKALHSHDCYEVGQLQLEKKAQMGTENGTSGAVVKYT